MSNKEDAQKEGVKKAENNMTDTIKNELRELDNKINKAKDDIDKLFNNLKNAEKFEEIKKYESSAREISSELRELGVRYKNIAGKTKEEGKVKKEKKKLENLDKYLRKKLTKLLNKIDNKFRRAMVVKFLNRIFAENPRIKKHLGDLETKTERDIEKEKDNIRNKLRNNLSFLENVNYQKFTDVLSTFEKKINNLVSFLQKEPYTSYLQNPNKDQGRIIVNAVEEAVKTFFVSKDKGIRTIVQAPEGKNRFEVQGEVMKILRKKLRSVNLYTDSIKTLNNRYSQLLIANRQNWERKVEKAKDSIQEYEKILDYTNKLADNFIFIKNLFDEKKKDNIIIPFREGLVDYNKYKGVIEEKLGSFKKALNNIKNILANISQLIGAEKQDLKEEENVGEEADAKTEEIARDAKKEEQELDSFYQKISEFNNKMNEIKIDELINSFNKVVNSKKSLEKIERLNELEKKYEDYIKKPLNEIKGVYNALGKDLDNVIKRVEKLSKDFNDEELINSSKDLRTKYDNLKNKLVK